MTPLGWAPPADLLARIRPLELEGALAADMRAAAAHPCSSEDKKSAKVVVAPALAQTRTAPR